MPASWAPLPPAAAEPSVAAAAGVVSELVHQHERAPVPPAAAAPLAAAAGVVSPLPLPSQHGPAMGAMSAAEASPPLRGAWAPPAAAAAAAAEALAAAGAAEALAAAGAAEALALAAAEAARGRHPLRLLRGGGVL